MSIVISEFSRFGGGLYVVRSAFRCKNPVRTGKIWLTTVCHVPS